MNKVKHLLSVLGRSTLILILLFIIKWHELKAEKPTIDSLRNELASTNSESDQIKIIRALMVNYRYLNYDSSYFYAKWLNDISKKTGDTKNESSSYQGLGIAHFFKENNDSAFFYFNQALSVAENTGDTIKASKYKGNIGMVHAKRGDFQKALEAYYYRLRICEKTKNKKSQSYVLHNIGYAYDRLGNYEKSIEVNHQALKLKLEMNDELSALSTYMSLASAHMYHNEGDSAPYYYQKSLILANKFNAQEDISTIQLNLGVYYSQTFHFNFDSAKFYLDKSLIYNKSNDRKENTARIYTNLGTTFYRIKRYEQALKWHQKAKAIFEKLKMKNSINNSLYAIAVNMSHLGRFEEAYELMHQSKINSDSIFSIQKTNAISEMQVKYETEKKEKELALQTAQLSEQELKLNQQQLMRNIALGGAIFLGFVAFLIYMIKTKSNKEVSNKNDLLSKSLSERESLLKEIHHRVKNNLQIVASLLYLQSDDTENKNLKKLLEEGQGRVRSMALIHQKLYENNDLKSIPFEEYLKELIDEIKNSFGQPVENVQLEVEAKDIYFDVDTAVPLGLIINELSTNAFKYAYSKRLGGTFKVNLTKEGDGYKMQVSDDGIGIPDSQLNNPQSKSLGLKLTKMLSDQLEGEYTFSNANGTTFDLKFAV